MPNKNSVQLNLPATFFMHLNAWAANNTPHNSYARIKGGSVVGACASFSRVSSAWTYLRYVPFSVGHLHGVISSCRPAKENRVSSKEESVTPVLLCVSDLNSNIRRRAWKVPSIFVGLNLYSLAKRQHNTCYFLDEVRSIPPTI